MKRIFLCLISLISVISILLTGCDNPGNNNPGTSETSEVSEISTADEAKLLSVFSECDNKYTFIRSEKASEELLKVFSKLVKTVKEVYSVQLEANDDWLKPGTSAPEHEIIIGKTNRPESEEALKKINNGEYIICVINEKIVINAASDDLIIKAMERFLSDVIKAGIPNISCNLEIIGKIELPINSIKLNGAPLSKYKIITKTSSKYKNAVDRLNGFLSENAGIELETDVEKNGPYDYEIVFGNSSRDPDASSYGYDSSAIYYKNGKLFLGCGSDETALMAVNVFINNYISGTGDIEINMPDNGTAVYKTETYDREKYIEDPTLLTLHWDGLWTPDAHMLDYQEKIDCLCCKNQNHIFTISHRGDFVYYPENSIESYISVWRMGGDCVESDLHYTKDGVCIIMHDATLTRMTNAANYIGKNGYPSDANISSWTYEQLKSLNLKSGQGGASASITPYKIPTLEEVLTVAKGRFFLVLDKQTEWKYCDISDIMTQSKNNYLLPLMEKTGNVESVLISYGHISGYPFTAEQALRVQKYIYEKTGQKPFFFLRGWTSGSAATYANTLNSGTLTNAAILVDGAFDPTNSSKLEKIRALKKSYPNSMLGGWTIDTNGYDCEKYWEVMYSIGMRSTTTNNMLILVKYAATK